MKITTFILLVLLLNIVNKTNAQHTISSQKPLLVAVGDSKFPIALIQLELVSTAAGSGNSYAFTMVTGLSDEIDDALNYLYNQFLKCEKFQLMVFDLDMNYTLNEIRSYPDAIITELTLPALDASSKGPAEVKLKMTASTVKVKPGDGAMQKFPGVGKKTALVANFKLKLDNFLTGKVSAISNLRFKNLPTPQQTCYSISDLSVTVFQVDAQPWSDWFDSRANGISKKKGEIQLLAANMKDVIAIFYVSEVEIISYTSSTSATNSQLQKATAVLRIGKAELKF